MSAPAVQTRRSAHGLLPFEQGALRVLLYFDIFGHPLTAEEIFSFLPFHRSSIEGLADVLRSGALKRVVQSKGRFFFLHSTPDSCIENRLRKERYARHRLRIASIVAHFVGLFPFVQAVMLSGELSKGVASRNSDIDFAIITRSHRLWICRTILILFKKVFLFNSKKYFCLNHFISEEDLSVQLRNIYSATEVATLKPLCHREHYIKYMEANQWIQDFFPNWNLSRLGCSIASEYAEGVTHRDDKPHPVHFLDRVDHWLMIRWKDLWQRRYAHLSDEERRHKFRCETSISTAYGEDYQQKILQQYSQRLRQYGISGLEQRN